MGKLMREQLALKKKASFDKSAFVNLRPLLGNFN